jgi:hypothetical protein
MYLRERTRKLEASAYLVGYALIAVPGTLFLLSSGKQVADWVLAGLLIAEFASAGLMRFACITYLKKGIQHEPI